MSDPSLSEVFEILDRTPAVLRSLLDGVGDSWLHASPALNSWSPYQILEHFLLGEQTDWVPRTKIILEHGASKTFEPFVRDGFDEEPKSAGELLDTIAELRARNVEEIRVLVDEPALALEGSHPDLGRVTLGQMLAAWAVHDLGHLSQIAEAMAKRYRTAIGPWRRYLPIVDRLTEPSG